jgi:hypothetical protein
VPTSEWSILTQGSNFAAVLNMEGVDSVRTVTDHVIHVEARLGIEAARALLGEFTSIYSNKTYADHRHVSVAQTAVNTASSRPRLGTPCTPPASAFACAPTNRPS